MIEALAIYDWLVDNSAHALRDPFDEHVLASVFALAIAEARAGGLPVCEGMGLTNAALRNLIGAALPHGLSFLEPGPDTPQDELAEDERCLRELLLHSTTGRTPFQFQLAAIIARRSMRPNHLWQDLGLRNRRQLSELMMRHFEPLARRNSGNMKWKKFFYRMICRDEGFRLCSAPSCAECDDFSVCFDDESGESLLARTRRATELVGISATLV